MVAAIARLAARRNVVETSNMKLTTVMVSLTPQELL